MCDGNCFDCGCCGNVVGMNDMPLPQNIHDVDEAEEKTE